MTNQVDRYQAIALLSGEATPTHIVVPGYRWTTLCNQIDPVNVPCIQFSKVRLTRQEPGHIWCPACLDAYRTHKRRLRANR